METFHGGEGVLEVAAISASASQTTVFKSDNRELDKGIPRSAPLPHAHAMDLPESHQAPPDERHKSPGVKGSDPERDRASAQFRHGWFAGRGTVPT